MRILVKALAAPWRVRQIKAAHEDYKVRLDEIEKLGKELGCTIDDLKKLPMMDIHEQLLTERIYAAAASYRGAALWCVAVLSAFAAVLSAAIALIAVAG